MPSPIIWYALCALTLLAFTSIRRIPEGQVYALRRLGGQMRLVGSGTHLVMPLVERVAHKISLAGATVAIEGLALHGQSYRGIVYFQVLDPGRAEVVIDEVEDLLRNAVKRLFADAALPDSGDIRRQWLKQSLNADLREHGLLIARVDIQPLD